VLENPIVLLNISDPSEESQIERYTVHHGQFNVMGDNLGIKKVYRIV